MPHDDRKHSWLCVDDVNVRQWLSRHAQRCSHCSAQTGDGVVHAAEVVDREPICSLVDSFDDQGLNVVGVGIGWNAENDLPSLIEADARALPVRVVEEQRPVWPWYLAIVIAVLAAAIATATVISAREDARLRSEVEALKASAPP